MKQPSTYLDALFLKALREGEEGGDTGESKFGSVPLGVDPNSLLNQPANEPKLDKRLRSHPLLSRSQQFSGVDPHLTALPADNPEAEQRYPELILKQQLRHQHHLRKGSLPILKR